jgi:hypothetical protein
MHVTGLTVEDAARRFAEQLLPLLDQCSHMLTRNLRTLYTLHKAPTSNVNIGQMNVSARLESTTPRQSSRGGAHEPDRDRLNPKSARAWVACERSHAAA